MLVLLLERSHIMVSVCNPALISMPTWACPPAHGCAALSWASGQMSVSPHRVAGGTMDPQLLVEAFGEQAHSQGLAFPQETGSAGLAPVKLPPQFLWHGFLAPTIHCALLQALPQRKERMGSWGVRSPTAVIQEVPNTLSCKLEGSLAGKASWKPQPRKSGGVRGEGNEGVAGGQKLGSGVQLPGFHLCSSSFFSCCSHKSLSPSKFQFSHPPNAYENLKGQRWLWGVSGETHLEHPQCLPGPGPSDTLHVSELLKSPDYLLLEFTIPLFFPRKQF